MTQGLRTLPIARKSLTSSFFPNGFGTLVHSRRITAGITLASLEDQNPVSKSLLSNNQGAVILPVPSFVNEKGKGGKKN